ncbi:MAG: hypothetical protein R3F07_16165 [Opitutaceae bacterium]
MKIRFLLTVGLGAGLFARNLFALPADPSFEAEGYEAARIEQFMLPVYPADPLKEGEKREVVYDLMISSEGGLIGSGAFYLPSAEFSEPMRDAVARWTFRPAQEGGRNVVGFFRYTVIDYFIDKERRRNGDYIPARPLWTIDRKLATRMNTLCAAREEDEHVVFGRIRVDFKIDASGAIKRFFGDDDLAKGLIRHYFEPARNELRFKPATRDGVPIESHLVLYLAPTAMGNHGEVLGADPVRSLPQYPGFGQNSESLEVSVVADFGPNGVVSSARIIDEVPVPYALQALLAVRSWRLSAEEQVDYPEGTPLELHFGFLSDSPEGVLIDPPRPIQVIPPIADRPLRDTFPPQMKSAFADGAVEIAFRVDEAGSLLDLEVTGTTNRIYSDWVLEDLSAMKFSPGWRDGQARAFRMVQRVSYVLYLRTEIKSDRDSINTRIPSPD